MRGHDTSVVMPYTRRRNEVAQPLAEQGYDVVFCDVSGSDEAYWEMLHKLWAQGRTFVVVEHDVIVRAGVIDELVNCEHPWCSFQVPYVGRLYAGLSCAKFTAALIARYPHALDRIAGLSDEDHPPKHWCRIDSHLQAYVLNPGGETMHVHGPPLTHIRDDSSPGAPWAIGPAHGCWR
jgi:hypothetical protein